MNYNLGVHITHCCLRHGCKYGDPGCTVENGNDEQEYPCESCTDEEHVVILGFHHWMGKESVPAEVLNLTKVEVGYLLPWDVLQVLMETYDVQLFHQTVKRGSTSVSGITLMLDKAGGKHRQR